MHRQQAFTLIELLVLVAVAALVLTLAAPSFSNFILLQRLKSINAQLVTDLQFARSEAASRNLPVRVRVGANASQSCYVLYVGDSTRCSCLGTPVCPAGSVEVRTVSIPAALSVKIGTPTGQSPEFLYDPTTGGIVINASDEEGGSPSKFVINTFIDTARALRTEISLSGRPSVCAASGSTMPVQACSS